MKLITIAFISFITASITFDTALKNGFILYQSENLKTIKYNCNYAGMWCSCQTHNNGGCSLGCSPNIYRTLYNQTSCPQLDYLILAGFTVSSV